MLSLYEDCVIACGAVLHVIGWLNIQHPAFTRSGEKPVLIHIFPLNSARPNRAENLTLTLGKLPCVSFCVLLEYGLS